MQIKQLASSADTVDLSFTEISSNGDCTLRMKLVGNINKNSA